MTTVTLSLFAGAGAQFLDNSGNVLTGGLIYTYAAGTTTLLATYTSNLGTTAHANPIVLDASGRVATGEIWLAYGLGYKFVLKDANNVLIGTYDNIPSAALPPIVNNAVSISYEQGATISAGAFVIGQMYKIATLGTTNFQSIGASANQVGIIFTATGVGSGTGTAQVSRTLQAKFGDTLSVKDFGAVGDGTTDDTAAIQAGVTACASSGSVLFMPAGTYKVTDTITMPRGTQISGTHVNTAANSYSAIPTGTVINFAPTTAKSLFVATGTYTGGFRKAYLIENLYIAGNSSNSSGNSVYAINAELVTDGLFRNLAIQYFRSGIYVKSTINNRFEYVRVINCYVECVLYDGNTATTDVWTQCYFSNAPIGINTTTNSVSLGIRFSNCIFESLTNYGVDLTKESFNWSFVDCYAEDTPASGSPTFDGAMFRLGYKGTTPSTNPIAYIIGGYYGGANNASLIGDGVRFGEISGAILVSPFFARYNYVLRGNTTTLNNSVTISGLNCIQSTGVSIDMTNKIQGFYANGLQNTGTLYQNGNFGVLTASQQLITNILKTVSGTNISPFADVTYDFGRLDARWNNFYAKVGYVVTTPDGTKNYRIAVDNAGAITSTLI